MPTVTRRKLQIALGFMWLLDGALQCQPFMFTSAFGRTVLAPAGAGQPALIAHPTHWASAVVIAHPVLTNAAFAAIQLALGVTLFFRRAVRWSLAASVVWGLSVWWLGEGLGGLTTGETLLTGAPGAAVLYAVVALLAFPKDGRSDLAPPSWAVPAWSALWIMAAGLQLAAGNNTGDSLAATLSQAGSDAGGWLGRLDAHLAHQHIGNGVVAAFIAGCVLIAMCSLIPGVARRASIVAGVSVASAAWLLTQGLGDLTSGDATDPNAGPLILIIGFAVLGVRSVPWPQWSPEATQTPGAATRRLSTVVGCKP